jgi:hypothetical protein
MTGALAHTPGVVGDLAVAGVRDHVAGAVDAGRSECLVQACGLGGLDDAVVVAVQDQERRRLSGDAACGVGRAQLVGMIGRPNVPGSYLRFTSNGEIIVRSPSGKSYCAVTAPGASWQLLIIDRAKTAGQRRYPEFSSKALPRRRRCTPSSGLS